MLLNDILWFYKNLEKWTIKLLWGSNTNYKIYFWIGKKKMDWTMLQSIISCRYYIFKQMEAQPAGNAIESCL